MRTREFVMAMACTLGLGVPSAQAQEHHGQMMQSEQQKTMMQAQQRMMGPGMMGMMGMMLPGPNFLLEQKDALDLTDQQVQRLEELKAQQREFHRQHMNRMPPLHRQAMDALHGGQPDIAAYESALETWADEHVKMQVEIARVWQKGLDVLTEEQRSNVVFGMHLMREMRENMMRQGRMMQMQMMREGAMDREMMMDSIQGG